MVKVRKAIESLYDDVCTITTREEYEKENGSIGFRDVIKVENEPCHLSFGTKTSTKEGDVAASVSQVVELFIRPDLEIPPGSKITVTHQGVTTDYTHSSVSANYATHQEIILDLFERWS